MHLSCLYDLTYTFYFSHDILEAEDESNILQWLYCDKIKHLHIPFIPLGFHKMQKIITQKVGWWVYGTTEYIVLKLIDFLIKFIKSNPNRFLTTMNVCEKCRFAIWAMSTTIWSITEEVKSTICRAYTAQSSRFHHHSLIRETSNFITLQNQLQSFCWFAHASKVS